MIWEWHFHGFFTTAELTLLLQYVFIVMHIPSFSKF